MVRSAIECVWDSRARNLVFLEGLGSKLVCRRLLG